MKIISEYKLTKEQIEAYQNKGYDVYYGYENPRINPGESVGILLDTMYKSTMDLIDYLVHRKIKSKVTIKYKDQVFHIDTPEEWKHTYQDEHDQLKQVTRVHPLLQIYRDKVKEYYQHLEHLKLLEQNKILDQNLDVPITLEDMTLFVRAFAHLYDIDIEFESNLSIKQAYLQIKYYLDNEIPYANDIRCIDYHEEPMFQNVKFLNNLNDTNPEIIGVGDENLLEDLVYKCKQSSFLVDQVLESML